VAIGPPGLLLMLLLFVPVILGLVTTIDASARPDSAFSRAGTSKTLWIVLPIAGVAFCGVVTIVAAIVWFTTVRPRVVAAAQAA
jgi:hypothetical protein